MTVLVTQAVEQPLLGGALMQISNAIDGCQ